ncbi:hypothetical protein SBBP2_880049 [Burkholderiales bacterium]|nr:hypothetical protein SBBP2_880049 [Burkholderiales bacterium]
MGGIAASTCASLDPRDHGHRPAGMAPSLRARSVQAIDWVLMEINEAMAARAYAVS